LIENQPSFHEIVQGDIFNVISEREFDLAYFDPPYGSNNEKMPPSRVRYLAYYHVWTTVCLNDQPPIFGKAGRREDSKDTVFSSPFEDFRRDETGHYVAVQAIRRLIEQTKSKYIILSYSSGGRATSEELQEVLENSGKILKVQKIDYKKNVMATMKWTNEWLNEKQDSYQELLFLLEKSPRFELQDQKQLKSNLALVS
jgi:adenine-specific DNA-methyltransferase